MTPEARKAYEKVRDTIDTEGRNLSSEDWISFLEEIECDCEGKREAAEQELDEL